MTTAILTIISAGLGLASALINRRRKAKPTRQQLTEKAIHAARTASATGDAAQVNALTERTRIQKHLLLPLAATLLLLTGCGCSLLSLPTPSIPPPHAEEPPKAIVIPADRYQYPMTNEQGVVGWFVPQAVHAEMVEAILLLRHYTNPTH